MIVPLRSDSSRRLFGERAESYTIKLVETKTPLHFMQRGSMLCYECGRKGVWQVGLARQATLAIYCMNQCPPRLLFFVPIAAL
jgi:hypothetical protein